MNKENKRMAQERRAEERKRQRRKNWIKNIVIVLVIVGFFGGMIGFGIWDSKQMKQNETTTQDTATESDEGDNTQSDTLDTDTSRAVKEGDTVAIYYEGSVDGIAFEGGTGEYDLLIGSHSFIDDFEEQLIGHCIGETVEVHVTFPENYNATYQDAEGEEKSLANAEAVFSVQINGIYN